MKKFLVVTLAALSVFSLAGCATGYDSTTDGYGYDNYYDGYGYDNDYYDEYNNSMDRNGYVAPSRRYNAPTYNNDTYNNTNGNAANPNVTNPMYNK